MSKEFKDWSDKEFLKLKQSCLDIFENENGEEKVIEYAECVPDLVDEIMRLRLLVNNHIF